MVVLHAVHLGRHRVRGQGVGLGDRQQGQRLVGIGQRGIQPGVDRVPGDHHRHPIVDVPGGIGGLGGDHRTGAQPGRVVVPGLGRIAPDLVDPGHHQRLAVGPVDEERLFDRLGPAASAGRQDGSARVPLVEPVGGEQAPPGAEGLAERRLLRHRLQPGVDHPGSDRPVLGPGRHQPPDQRGQPAPYRSGLGLLGLHPALEDGRHGHGRGHVVVRAREPVEEVVHLELRHQVGRGDRDRISPAHGPDAIPRRRQAGSALAYRLGQGRNNP